jgi:hypothetical protein
MLTIIGTDISFEYFALYMNILDTSPRNENLNILVRIKFLFYKMYIHFVHVHVYI